MSEPTAYDYSKYKALKLNLVDGIMTLTLSNPSKRNAMNVPMSQESTTIWDDLWLDPAVKVIILTGEGNDFCSGVDLSGLGARDWRGPTHPATRSARANARPSAATIGASPAG